MADIIVMLRQLNADEKVKQEAYYREKRLHDEAYALNNAKREGKANMVKRLFELGNTVKQIAAMFKIPETKVEEYLAMKT